MCTVALLFRPGELLCVSGNRNEMLARPALGPRLRDGVLAPEDLQSGGTWLGLNQRGLFVVVTNRARAIVDPARTSRGVLVREALAGESARELHARLADLPGDRHNGFHLVYADLHSAFVTWSDGYRLAREELAPGRLHVITERSFGAGAGAREVEVAAAFGPLLREPSAAAWREPMRRHAAEPLESACVHAETVGYGTRSSLQLLLRARGAAELLFTEGHPCTEPAQDLAELAADLFG